jgi:hypothetical protein
MSQQLPPKIEWAVIIFLLICVSILQYTRIHKQCSTTPGTICQNIHQ